MGVGEGAEEGSVAFKENKRQYKSGRVSIVPGFSFGSGNVLHRPDICALLAVKKTPGEQSARVLLRPATSYGGALAVRHCILVLSC